MRFSAAQSRACLLLLLLVVANLAAPAGAQTLGEPTAPPPASTTSSFSIDDWQDHLRAPDAPSRSRLYQGDDANAIANRPVPVPPPTIVTGHLPAQTAPSITPKTKTDDDRLAAIAITDRDFFQALNEKPDTWPEAERDKRAQDIFDHYSAYITDHPEDVTALILYGKLLNHVGQPDLAYQVFRRADQLSPNLAVIKQQLGNHLAETGKYAPALDLLRKATALAPSEPVYHYEIGELLNIYYDHFLADKIFDAAGLDKTMEVEFARAAELAPLEKGFAWRHAECFYDQRNPDWPAALAAWTTLASQTTVETELEVIHLHQARDLIELGKFDAARPLLEQPVMKALETSRATLLKRLPDGATTPAAPVPPAAS